MSRVASAVVVFAVLFVGQLAGLQSIVWDFNGGDSSAEQGSHGSQDVQTPETGSNEVNIGTGQSSLTGNQFTQADDTIAGVLQPAGIEQRGYVSSGILRARTDTHEGTSTNLSIDAVHGWKADLAQVNVSGLQKLYVVNGTFDTGTPGSNVNPNGSVSYRPDGWDATSYTTDTSETEVATYDPSGTRFVSVTNEGRRQGNNYVHVTGTNINWTQRVTNVPRTTQFVLRFSYMYLSGPRGSGFSGTCHLYVYLNQTQIWNQSLPAVSNWGVWYNTGSIIVDKPSIGNVFDFKIGLMIDSQLTLSPNSDYDGDGHADGIVNAAYITVDVDNVSFVGASPPAFGAVNLQFKAGSATVPITGASGNGSASISNPSFWTSSPLTASLQSNTSVSFYYVARLLSHYYGNSTCTTEMTKTGVSYDAHIWSSSDLRLFTYIGSLGSYEQFSLRITIPRDWGNVTVYDPFLTDVTSQCSVALGLVTIPQNILDRLGWWQITLQAPNYARSVTIQKYSSGTGNWLNDTNFRIGNTTRGLVAIGRGSSHPAVLTDVNVTWALPNGTSWYSEKLGPSTNGTIKTASHVIDASAAGRWQLTVLWSNGSELAYADSYFAVYHRTSLVPVYALIETDDGQIVANVLRYTDTDTGEYLTNDSATIRAEWSASIVNFLPNLAKKWWEADFDTSLVTPGTRTVRANASMAYFDDSYCTFVIRSYVRSRLSSPNAPWTSCGWNQTCDLTFLFEAYNHTAALWIPVTNSSGDVRVYANWTSGEWTVEQSATPGVYNVLLDTGAMPAGNWLMNVTIVKSNYETAQVLLTLIVSRAASSLVTLGGGLVQADVDETVYLKLKYLDEGGSPVGSANVTVQDVVPPEGLQLSQVAEVPGETGNYSLSLTAKAPGVFAIRMMASAANLEPAIAVFVLSARDIATNVTLFSGDSASIGLTDTFTAVFRYEMWNGSGIGGADISAAYSGPSLGLNWSAPQPLGVGNYSIDFYPSGSGTYLVTIAASKQFYRTSSDSFFLIVGDISSQLVLVNSTSGVIEIGESYRLVVRYANTTGYGLDGADVHIDSFIPESGLDIMPTVPLGNGYYSIVLHPTLAVPFVVLVKASIANHQVRFATFTLNCMKMASVLLFDNATTTIPIDRNFTLFMRFQTESLQGLPNATIVVTNTPVGLEFDSVRDLGDGRYSLTIVPLAMGAYDVVLRASLQNYQNASAAFTLGVVRIPTSLRTATGASVASVEFGHTYDLVLLYERTDLHQNVTGAQVSMTALPEEGLTWTTYEDYDGYHVLLESGTAGTWSLTILAEGTDYNTASVQFTLEVTSIATDVNGTGPQGVSRIGKATTFTLRYHVFNSSTGIAGAVIYASGESAAWFSYIYWGNGRYNVTITPGSIGDYAAVLTFICSGYETQRFPVSFSVTAIPMGVQLLSATLATEGVPFEVRVRIYETEGGSAVSGAEVMFRISPMGAGEFHLMEETAEAGTYRSTYTIPTWQDYNSYTLEFKVNKDNYTLSAGFSVPFVKMSDLVMRWTPMIAVSGSSVFVLMLGLIGLRVSRQRKRARNIEALSVKRRFDDVSNMLGIIVMQKSGIPLYSKVFRGGFDESMVSAFITAITNFRSEFGMDEKHWDFQVIPISDIISAVPTKNLICAFVTVSAPSAAQEVKMEAYGRAAGAMFDDIFATPQSRVLSPDTLRMFDSLFNDLMDGSLLEAYKTSAEASIPRNMKCLQSAASHMLSSEGFKLDELAKGMASCGVEEAMAYKIIIDAIERSLLVRTKESEGEVSAPFVARSGESS